MAIKSEDKNGGAIHGFQGIFSLKKAAAFLLLLSAMLALASCGKKTARLMLDSLELETSSGERVTLHKGDEVTVTDRRKRIDWRSGSHKVWFLCIEYNGMALRNLGDNDARGSKDWIREGYFKDAGKVYHTGVINVDSVDLPVPWIDSVLTLHKGDEVIIRKSFREGNLATGGSDWYYSVTYNGYNGRIMRKYVDSQAKKVTIDGVETSRNASRTRPIAFSEMAFGNAILLAIGFFIMSAVALLVGQLLSAIPFIGKFIFALIVLAVLAVWGVMIHDFIMTGAIWELVVVGVLCIVGCFLQGPKIVGVFIMFK